MLYVHKGASKITLPELRASYRVPTREEMQKARGRPDAGKRWKPLHHADLVEEIERAAGAMGLAIQEEGLAVSKDTHDLYGFMQFRGLDLGLSGLAPVLGFRSSNMQRFALMGVSGARVFICDNGAIVGDFVFGMKHTSGNVGQFEVGIAEGLATWESQAKRMKELVMALQRMVLSDKDSDHLLMEGVRDGVFANQRIPAIDDTYRAYTDQTHPHHQAFAERNAWSLYNAVTEVAKGTSPRLTEGMLKGFPRTLARVGGIPAGIMDAPAVDLVETGRN